MTTSLPYGKRVVELARRFPERKDMTVVVRHSERPDFAGVPKKDWNDVGLTSNGFEAARMMGRALAQITEASQLDSYGWGWRRCLDTANAIAAGATAAGYSSAYLGPIHMKSPIANRQVYDRQLGTKDLEETILDWLNDKDQNVFVPVREYTKEILERLVAIRGKDSDAFTVVATHDLHILPLLSGVFGKPIRYIDYLDGLVIRPEGESIKAGYGDTIESYQLR